MESPDRWSGRRGHTRTAPLEAPERFPLSRAELVPQGTIALFGSASLFACHESLPRIVEPPNPLPSPLHQHPGPRKAAALPNIVSPRLHTHKGHTSEKHGKACRGIACGGIGSTNGSMHCTADRYSRWATSSAKHDVTTQCTQMHIQSAGLKSLNYSKQEDGSRAKRCGTISQGI